jgi:hypothetical protein
MLATATTGLSSDTTHYWGSAIGDVDGYDATTIRVNSSDIGLTRSNSVASADILNIYDLDRDGDVDADLAGADDADVARDNQTGFSVMNKITVP